MIALKVAWDSYKIITDTSIEEGVGNRGNKRVLQKAAFANAVGDMATLTQLGSVMGRDHSTIIHYRRNHDTYEKYYQLYNDFTEVANKVILDVFIPASKSDKLSGYKKILDGLRKQIKTFEELLVV